MKACVAVVMCAGLLAACSGPSNPEGEKAAAPAVPKAAASGATTAKALVSGIDKANMDATARPQDDFYRYVNGHWLDTTEIPPDKLFFAGGGGSVRGYGYKSIGVPGPGGIVTGGRYLLEASLEARYKVTNDIGVVGFVDGGYVAADTFPGLDDLRVGAGIGLRYYTGLGPLRLDAAVPLNKHAGDPDYALYVGIGQAF